MEDYTTLRRSSHLLDTGQWQHVRYDEGFEIQGTALTGRLGFTGWSNWIGQVTGAPSVDYALSAMILAGASISNPSYVPQNFHIFLLTTLVMLIHACISSMPTKWIANFNSVGSTFNIIALCIVLILIPAATNRQDQGLPRFTDSSTVWGNFYPGTEFPNGVALLMTFVAVIWTMRWVIPGIISRNC